MDHINLKVDGMACGGCEKSIQNALLSQSGVESVTASHQNGTVEVAFDANQIQPEALRQAIEAAGFDVAS